jgi:hypothetical protein
MSYGGIAMVILARWAPSLVFVAVASILGGCGSDTPVSPVTSADRTPLGVRSGETRSVQKASGTFSGQTSGVPGSVSKASSRATRLEAFRDQIGQESDPIAAAEVLYAALNDPDPKIQEEAAKWLRLLVAQDDEVREEVKMLQSKEHSLGAWQRAADLLDSREESSEDNPE